MFFSLVLNIWFVTGWTHFHWLNQFNHKLNGIVTDHNIVLRDKEAQVPQVRAWKQCDKMYVMRTYFLSFLLNKIFNFFRGDHQGRAIIFMVGLFFELRTFIFTSSFWVQLRNSLLTSSLVYKIYIQRIWCDNFVKQKRFR